ncbi:MAG: GMC family oxidoreductase [Gammaproteobacteria bacterium]|nr:GMC family oxidoreductase [Gammaproteobacteria bacterium]MBU1555117.1 GMC family oxidoreductase [Gammaproteobacteria bacterium]MBU2069509.1 GMC family oxidoreductase [Gammaproteobacteria bacterium]MBU2183013.1 GMC family oxidoreductase [Gammaproteobacteria bacterium]MBU2206658.1 GMC family oxidoreductase [Gammaproteobacteria bacterium]
MNNTHLDASQFTQDQQFDTDIVIIGSGAGGGIAAEQLARAGFNILLLEEGAYYSRDDFVMQERWAYPNLYQEGAARKTRDQAIGILQGRTVGGSTTVNWTTSIRTPQPTLDYWHSEFGLNFTGDNDLTPYFSQAEKRLNIHQWPVAPNANNAKLQQGCEALGWQYTVISRNVNGCANLGYCGMGCPINAKQSMLASTIPAAVALGARLISRISVRRLHWQGDSITALEAVPVDQHFQPRSDISIRIKAKHYIVAAGAIGSPALLLRSKVPDPSGRLGKHTYLHPTVISGALFDENINGHSGAPQSIYSDQFVWPQQSDTAGFKLEVPPLHPVLMATKLIGTGEAHAALMQQFNQLQVTIALLRDGFHPQSQGGTVQLDSAQQPLLDYPISDYLWQGMRNALLAMAQLQFAAGAKQVLPIHHDATLYSSWAEAKAAIQQLPMQKLRQTVVSAHVMGGCNMSADATKGVVDQNGRHHQLQNLSVFDGSILPTSLGANPQLTIYALVWRNCQRLISMFKY